MGDKPKIPMKSYALVPKAAMPDNKYVKKTPYDYEANAVLQGKLTAANMRYHLGLTPKDTYVVDNDIFICTRIAARMLKVTFHTFSTTYSGVISRSSRVRVRRYIAGRNKYYNLDDLDKLVAEAIKYNCSVLDLCIMSGQNKEQQ